MVFRPLIPQGRYHITGSQKVIRKPAEWLRDSSAAGKGKEDSTAKRCDAEMESCFLKKKEVSCLHCREPFRPTKNLKKI